MTKPTGNPIGRPSGYSPELADRICEELAKGRSMRSIGKDENMPSITTMFTWIRQYPEFAAQYDRAKEESADCHADEIIDIADDGSNDWMQTNDPDNPGWKLNGEHVARSRLRVDSRKWIASKLKPKRWGDKIAVGGDPDAPPIKHAVVEMHIVDHRPKTEG